MIDVEAEIALIDELTDMARDPNDVARVSELEALLSRTDATDQTPHAAIFARSLLAGHLIMTNADDLAPVLGLFAETQNLMEAHSDELISDVFVPILVQSHVTIMMLLENPSVPLDRVEALLANFEQLCRQTGNTLRGVYALAMRIAIRRGDHDAAERLFAQLQAQPRDTIVIGDTVEEAMEWYTDRGMYEEALHLFQRATPEDEGDYYRYVQMAALIPAQRTGRTQLAEQLFNDSFDMDDIDGDAPRLTYLALAGRYDQALELMPLIMEPQDFDTDRSRAQSAKHAAVLLSHLQALGRGSQQVSGMDATVDELFTGYLSLAESNAQRIDQVNKMDAAMPNLQRFWANFAPRISADSGRTAGIEGPHTAPTSPNNFSTSNYER